MRAFLWLIRLSVMTLLLATLTAAASGPKATQVGCSDGEVRDPKSGKCAKAVVCPPDQEAVLNRCMPKCLEGMTRDNSGKCRGCPTGQVEDPKSGKCAKAVVCPPDQEAVLNRCVPRCPAGTRRVGSDKCTKAAAGR